MKKLLSLLSSVVLVGATVSGVTACSTKEKNNQHKDAKGDSIWAWIPGVLGGKEITSRDIWSVLENPFVDAGNGQWTNDPNQWDGATRIKMSVQLMQILSVAILANPDKFFTKENKIDDIADYKDLKDILKKQWELLVISTNNTVEKKKQSFKDSDQKNWEKKYHDFLDANYKDISCASGNKKYEIEEQNYKTAIITTGADGGISATQMLTNVLLNNNMRIYKQNTTNSSVEFLRNFAAFLKEGKAAKDWNSNSQNLRIQLVLAFTWDPTTNTFGKDFSKLTIAEIDSRLAKIADVLKTHNYDYKAYMGDNHPPVATPVFENSTVASIETPILSETYDIGQFSLFQKYMIEKWFQNEKPLAISKITYAFKSGAAPTDTGFTTDSFDETTKKQINNDLNVLTTAKSWNEFTTNSSEGTVTSSSNLLTLSTQGDAVKSNILKASVYDSVGATGETAPKTLDEVVAKINRKSINDPISGNWKIGNSDIVVSFFDTNGLNLVHIDEREYLQNATPTSYNTYNVDWQFRSLNYSSNTYNAMDDKSKIMTTDTNKQMMNTQFSNSQYLWYLINRSLVNSSSNSKLKFKVLDEVKKYATLNSSSGSADDKTWWFWIYDFFNNFNNKILKNGNAPQEWLKKFITFKDGQGQNNADWFILIINAMASNLAGGTVQRLYNSFETENKTIQGYKTGGAAAEIKTKSIVDKISAAQIWQEENNTNYAIVRTNPSETLIWVHELPPAVTNSTEYYYGTGR